MNLFNTQRHTLTQSSIFPTLCPTEPLNFLHPIPSYLSGATSLSAKGTLTQPPLLSSLSRHCCCEDEMSVLLKVPLKHNSDLWCLIVSFQSYEQGREHILTHWGHFKAVTDYWGGGHNFRRTDTVHDDTVMLLKSACPPLGWRDTHTQSTTHPRDSGVSSHLYEEQMWSSDKFGNC